MPDPKIDTAAPKEVRVEFIPVAFFSGLAMTLSAVVVAYPAQRAAKSGSELSSRARFITTLANLILTGFSVVLGGWAIGMAPAAVAFALSTGSSLLTNMIIQTLLRLATFSKNMVVGTLVLATAVCTLPEIGPTDPVGEVNVAALLSRGFSVGFVVLSLLGQLLAIVAIRQQLLSANSALLLAYAYIGAVGTVLNNCIVKVGFTTGLDSWQDWLLFIPFMAAYVVEALIGVSSAILANGTLEDPSVFVPTTAGVNVVMQCLAGLFIWEDGLRIEFPIVYGMIYFLIVLGIYDISTFDFLGGQDGKDVAQNMTELTGRLGIPSFQSPSRPTSPSSRSSELTVRY